jgi:hypothetical protein
MSGTFFLTVVVSGTDHSSDAEISSFPHVKLYFILGHYLSLATELNVECRLKGIEMWKLSGFEGYKIRS